jgi:peptide/nickel transport system permease protein
MRNYILRRAIQSAIIVLAVSYISFLMLSKLGNPFTELLMNPYVKPEDVQKLIHLYHWDLPFLPRYFYWLKNFFLFQNGWGPSTMQIGQTALGLIRQKISITITIMLSVMGLSFLIAIFVGTYSALHQYTTSDFFFTFLAFFGISMPVFWTGIVLMYVFSVFPTVHLFGHPILPAGSMHSTFLTIGGQLYNFYQAPFVYQILDRIWHLILPIFVLILWNVGGWLRYTRSSMLEVIKQDYIRTARAKGLPERVVIYKHAFRNAIIPVTTLLGLSLPNVVGGALITETVFSIDGIGRLTYSAVMQRDLFTAMALIMVFSILTVVGNLLADIFYAVLDPRIRYS